MPHLPSEHAASLPPHPTRAAEYVRMSTEHQQYSTENQEEAIRQYAARRGIEIVRTYADAFSGASRPAILIEAGHLF